MGYTKEDRKTYLFALVIDMNFKSGILFFEAVKSSRKVGRFGTFRLERK
jgi:hypothetical protein